MNQKSDSESVSANMDGCIFPTGPDEGQVCARLVKNARPGAGRPPLYCDNPDHTRANAYVARRTYALAAARSGRQGGVQAQRAVSQHPVTEGLVSFGALVARFEQSSTQLATIINRAVDVVRTIGDPEAAGYEVEQAQREAAIQVAQANTAQATAEQETRNTRHQAAREAEQRAQADEAANQALHHIDQLHNELADAHNAQARAEADKHSAQQDAQRDRATIQALQQQLEQQRQDHHHDLETLRQQAHTERTALTQHYTDHITTLLTTIQHPNSPIDPQPAAPKTHPSRAKKQ